MLKYVIIELPYDEVVVELEDGSRVMFRTWPAVGSDARDRAARGTLIAKAAEHLATFYAQETR